MQSLPVLIVDDNVTSGRILGGMTASWGMSPTVVTSGPAGIEALHAAAKAGRAFRLVLADVCMPGMGGLDMVADVREKTPVLLAKTAVVGLTLALSAAEHAERMRELMVQVRAMVVQNLTNHESLSGALLRQSETLEKLEACQLDRSLDNIRSVCTIRVRQRILCNYARVPVVQKHSLRGVNSFACLSCFTAPLNAGVAIQDRRNLSVLLTLTSSNHF